MKPKNLCHLAANGRPKVVVAALSDEGELERLVLAHPSRFMALLDPAQERIAKGSGVKHGDFWGAAARLLPARCPPAPLLTLCPLGSIMRLHSHRTGG